MTKNNAVKICKTTIIPLLLAFIVYQFNSYVGKKGVYLFDFSIFHNMGWLIFNGQIPFIDFKMPLMPLSGTLVALSYWLFGIKYYSAVKLSGILSAITFLIMATKLKKYIGYYYGYLASLLIITPIMQGTMFYNLLNMLLFSVYLILVVDYIMQYKLYSENQRTLSSTIIFALIGLMAFNKFHIGFLAGILFAILEFILIKQESLKVKKLLPTIIIRISPIVILIIAILIWTDFHIIQILDYLFRSADLKSNIVSDYLLTKIGLGGRIETASSAGITIYLSILISIGIALYHLKYCKNNFKANNLAYLIMSSLIVQILSFLASWEAPFIDIPFIMTNLIIMYIYCVEVMNTEFITEEKTLFLCKVFLISIFISCATFAIYFVNSGVRKNWDEGNESFLTKNEAPKNKHYTEIIFFETIKINRTQKKNFDYLNQILQQYSTKSIFFGPELEMFYPAIKALPPKNWPVWVHPNLSYNNKYDDSMKENFIAKNPDIIFMSKVRYGFTYFVNEYIENNYYELKQPDKEIWIRVFVRKIKHES